MIYTVTHKRVQDLENTALSAIERNLQNWQDNMEFMNKMESGYKKISAVIAGFEVFLKDAETAEFDAIYHR